MHSFRRQTGVALLPLLLAVSLVVVVATVTIKMGPYYLDYFSVKSLLDDMADEPELDGQSMGELKAKIGRRLSLNQISYLNSDDFVFERLGEGFAVTVDYQVQEHLFFNIDVILTFNHKVDM